MFDSFATAGIPTAFDAEAFYQNAHEQGAKLMELQQGIATAQLEQLAAASAAGQQQLQTLSALQTQALRDSMSLMLDMQKSTLNMWKPASA